MSYFFVCTTVFFYDYVRGFGLFASSLESVDASSLESVDSSLERFSIDWRTLYGKL